MHYYSSGSIVGPQPFSVDIFPGSNSIRHEAGVEGLASDHTPYSVTLRES